MWLSVPQVGEMVKKKKKSTNRNCTNSISGTIFRILEYSVFRIDYERERERERQIDRQIDRQTDR